MINYELVYKHPSLVWDHDGDDFWFDQESTYRFTASNLKCAMEIVKIFLLEQKDWGDYDEKSNIEVPPHVIFVNQPVKLVRIAREWKISKLSNHT